MEKLRNITENKKFQEIIFISCFVFSVVCFILFISQVYSFAASPNPPVNNKPLQNNSNPPQMQPPAQEDFFKGIPKGSPLMLLVFLLGFVITFLAGIVIYQQQDKKEKKNIRKELLKNKKEAKSKVINQMLLPEEKFMVKILEDNKGERTQSDLVKKSKLNKLKVSRILKKLESLKIIEKHPYGMTNNIRLKK